MIEKAVIPATKAQPKEMLPVVDKPVIQYVVEEALSSAIKDILIITILRRYRKCFQAADACSASDRFYLRHARQGW